MLACPHCNALICMRQVKHEGWFTTRRTCPSCNLSFDVDAKTKVRQAFFLFVLILSLILTVLAYVYGVAWGAWAVASYILAGGMLYYGNKKMCLVKAPGVEKE